MRIDWSALEAEYLRGGTTYKALAANYGVSERTIERHASKGHWEARRREVVDQVAGELPGVVAQAVLDEAEQFTTAHFEAWQALGDRVSAMVPLVTKPSDLLALANAFRAVVEGQRKVLGLDDKRKVNQADTDLDEAIRLAEDREHVVRRC